MTWASSYCVRWAPRAKFPREQGSSTRHLHDSGVTGHPLCKLCPGGHRSLLLEGRGHRPHHWTKGMSGPHGEQATAWLLSLGKCQGRGNNEVRQRWPRTDRRTTERRWAHALWEPRRGRGVSAVTEDGGLVRSIPRTEQEETPPALARRVKGAVTTFRRICRGKGPGHSGIPPRTRWDGC